MNHEDHPHPLLAQVPLTVSPFISLPTATPLPYTYKTLPSTLPPSITDPPAPSTNTTTATSQPSDADGATQQAPPPKPAYVVSSSGHAAHPDDIIASCRALQTHLTQLIDDSRSVVAKWEGQIRERDLARKRQIAPGWLDQDVKMLEPERKGAASSSSQMQQQQQQGPGAVSLLDDAPQLQVQSDEGEQLDRAFGGMNIK